MSDTSAKTNTISDLLLGTHNLSVRGQKNVCKELLGTLEAIKKPIEGERNLRTD